MKNATVAVGDGDMRVTLEAATTDGQGLCCFLYGGTLPHVGGQALACPGVAVRDRQLSRCDLWTATVPGHRDVEVAAAVARRLCLAYDEPVSVTAGIHVDDATPEQVQTLYDNCLRAADEAMVALGSA